jgi:hypothetical protein
MTDPNPLWIGIGAMTLGAVLMAGAWLVAFWPTEEK